MVSENRLEEILLKALNDLQRSLDTKNAGVDGTLSKKIWEIGADLEHLLFLMSLSRKLPDEMRVESEKISRTVNLETELSTVQTLLKEASIVLTTDLKEAYNKVWSAQGHLLGVQRQLEKTKFAQSRI